MYIGYVSIYFIKVGFLFMRKLSLLLSICTGVALTIATTDFASARIHNSPAPQSQNGSQMPEGKCVPGSEPSAQSSPPASSAPSYPTSSPSTASSASSTSAASSASSTSTASSGMNQEIRISCPKCQRGNIFEKGQNTPSPDVPRIEVRCVPAKMEGTNKLTSDGNPYAGQPKIAGQPDATDLVIPAGTYKTGFVKKGYISRNASNPNLTFTTPKDGQLMMCVFEFVGGKTLQYIYADQGSHVLDLDKILWHNNHRQY